jgi:hypothetical protein
MSPETWLELIKVIGPIGTMLVYFIWRDWMNNKDQIRREHNLGARLDLIVDLHNKAMEKTITVMETTIRDNTQAMNNVRDGYNNLKQELRDILKKDR